MTKTLRTRLLLGSLIVISLVVALAGGALWIKRYEVQRYIEKSTLPEPVKYQPSSPAPSAPFISSQPTSSSKPQASTSRKPNPSVLPATVNLDIPFTVQAPHANWDDPYGELCEEASVLMTISYLRNESIASPDIADQKLLAIKAFEDATFGYYEDTTAAETLRIFQEFYDYPNASLIENPTIEDIKAALAAGKPVLVPAAGRALGNPYFQQPGPLYHMLVIKGYTSDGKFIVNDPGTRRGADFLYDQTVIMNAMHDWRSDRNIDLGKKVIIIAG